MGLRFLRNRAGSIARRKRAHELRKLRPPLLWERGNSSVLKEPKDGGGAWRGAEREGKGDIFYLRYAKKKGKKVRGFFLGRKRANNVAFAAEERA